MSVTREQVVAEGRKWLGTPFAHQGRLLGVGCDCVGIPLEIAGALKLNDKSGMPLNGACFSTYSAQPLGSHVHDMCMEHLEYKPVREMLPGDVLSMQVVTAACHVALVTEDAKGRACILHAYSGGPGKVVEHLLDEKWRRRIVGCFKFPEVHD